MKEGNKPLNVVYIGPQSFPVGGATSKRRRYMVDYMNAHDIQSHYLVCDFKQRGKRQNATEGTYGQCEYQDITPLANEKRFLAYWKKGKSILKKWYMEEAKNVLVFDTLLCWFDYPFYSYARKLGYKIVFDQVETSYLQNGKVSLWRKLNLYFSEWLSDMAFRHSSAFVISSALMKENTARNPGRKLCLLPNSTPVLNNTPKQELNLPLRLLYSGTYAPKDGVEYLIDGVIEAHDNGCECILLLLGKGNSNDMKVLEKIKGKKYIEYRGFVTDEELIDEMVTSDVLCMTRCNSLFANYGFPFKLSEYLATGNILLATNVGDVCQYVTDRKSAYIVEPENSHEIAKTIKHIISNSDEAIRIANGGFDIMQKHFSVERVGRTLENFLREI